MLKSCALSLAMVLGLTCAAVAAEYPAKPIQVVVPWKPGGSTDVSARIMAEAVKDILPQPLIVSNITGAMGLNGALHVVTARPDGYTLIWEHPGNLAVSPLLAKSPFTWRDFDPVCVVAKSDTILVVNRNSPFNSPKEVFDHIKANPGALRWPVGINGVSHFTFLAISESLGGLDVKLVPMAGDKNRIVSLLSGNADVATIGFAGAAPYIKSGDLKLLAVVNSERSPYAPDTPTLMEQGIKASYDFYYTALAPKGTPESVKDVLGNAFKQALTNQKTKESLARQSLVAFYRDPAETARLWGELEANWSNLAVKYGLMKK